MARKRDIRLVDSIVKKLGLSQDQRELLHEALRHDCLQDATYQDILDLAREIKQEYPGKSQTGKE